MSDPRTLPRLSGQDLATLRGAVGLTQTDLARATALTRYPVSRWESKAVLDLKQDTSKHLLAVLVPPGRGQFRETIAHARGDGVLGHLQQRVRAALRAAQLETERASPPVLCGARTRKGHPCRNVAEPGRRRCKFHGGMSTGPRTAEGRARIAEAQRRRWRERERAEAKDAEPRILMP